MKRKQRNFNIPEIMGILILVNQSFASPHAYFKIPCFLRNVTDSSAMICWEWSKPTNSVVVYGQSTNYSDSAEVNHNHISFASLSGLLPRTRYYYNIIVDNKAVLTKPEDYYFFTAPQNPKGSITFAAIGDTRTGEESFNADHEAVIESIKHLSNPLFLLHLGDMVDITENNSWTNFFTIESEILKHCPIYPVLGNSDGTSEDFIRQFQIPGNTPWYSFSFASVYCINLMVLDNKSDQYYRETIGPESQQYTWLKQELQSELRKNTSFTIISFFAPLFGERENKFLTRILCPLFRENKVDLVLNGGDHYFSYYQQGEVVYLISGGGGAALQRVKKSSSKTAYFTHAAFHHIRMSVFYPTMTIDALDNSGTIFFSHTITTLAERKVYQELETTQEGTTGITIELFGTPDCEECSVIKNDMFPRLENKYADYTLSLQFHNVDQDTSLNRYHALEYQLGSQKHSFPVVKIGSILVSGDDLVIDNVDLILQQVLSDKKNKQNANQHTRNRENIIFIVIGISLGTALMIIIIRTRSRK